MDQVSPVKFATLPEDIQARIIRQGKGIVSKTHQKLTMTDQVRDAGTKSFTKTEVEWLSTVHNTLLLFYGYISSAYIYRIATPIIILEPADSFIQLDRLDIEADGNRIIVGAPKLTPSFSNISDIVPDLIGRFDSTIFRSSYVTVYLNGQESDADVVLIDVRSIFLILQRRFKSVFTERATILAREWTQKALDNIVDDYPYMKMVALLGYLIFNTSVLGLNIDRNHYFTGVKTKGTIEVYEEHLEDIQKSCTILYEMISTAIAGFH